MSRNAIRIAAAGAAVAVVLLLYTGWLVADDVRLPSRSTDQLNIGLMVLKDARPDLLARDPAFSDPAMFRFYTPAFLRLVAWLDGRTGGFDATVRLLLPLLTLLYAAGMYVLLLDVSRSVPAAAVVTVVSALLHRCLGSEFWGVAAMKAVLPRSLFLTLVPWLALALLRWRRGGPGWLLAAMGLASGLAANLHPVSGLAMTQILLTVALLSRPVSARHAAGVGLAGVLALAGASPFILHFAGQTGGVPPPPGLPFAEFRAVLLATHRTFFPFGQPHAWMSGLAAASALAIGAWVAAALRRGEPGRSPSRWPAAGVWIAIPAAASITLMRAWPLLIAAIVESWRLSRRQADHDDEAIVLLLAAAVFWGLVAPWLLDAAWAATGRWELSALVGEQGRAGRFVFLPLFLMAARALARLPRRWPAAARAAAVLAAGAVLAAPSLSDAIKQRHRTFESEAERRALMAAGAWAREHTGPGALFYTGDLEFRLRAERSITHCRKDLGLSYYSRRRFGEMRDRLALMEEARGDAARLIDLARRHRIDYIVEEKSRPLPFPMVYENDHYAVYTPATAGSAGPC